MTADEEAWRRALRPKEQKLASCDLLRWLVEAALERRWSPERIAGWLRRSFPDQPELWVSHETIYQSLYVQARGALRKELTAYLRRRQVHRKPRGHSTYNGQGRLHGVLNISERPAEAADRAVTVKDTLDVEGLPTTAGIPALAGSTAEQDEPHVARLRAQGAIVVGKTNVAQGLAYIEADNPPFGRTNNPWRLDRTCGGTSGGEAAVVAAGASPLGVGWALRAAARVLRAAGQGSLGRDALLFARVGQTSDYWSVVEEAFDYRAAFVCSLREAGIGLVLGPATPIPAFPHGGTMAHGSLGAYTILYNLVGLPAGVVPVAAVREGEQWTCGPTPDRARRARRAAEAGSVGLPVGVQVAGPVGGDDLVLAALGEVEAGPRAAGTHPGVPLLP